MAVRAKFRVTGVHDMTSITGDGGVESKQVTLQAVYGGDNDEANKEWSKWTPSGELRMTITNPAAYEQLRLGKSYYLDLVPVDEQKEAHAAKR